MSDAENPFCLVLRLAAPLQSWGSRSQFNRRDTATEPTKSGVIGLLAAAQGRRRQDPIEDLLELSLGVRTDQPGSLLRDYHTVSDLRGRPLLSAAVTRSGAQKPTSPPKHTHVTQRFYLQDAVFVAAISGPAALLETLHTALRRPAFPLSLGRRACAPTQPLIITPPATDREPADNSQAVLWRGDAGSVLDGVPWQAAESWKRRIRERKQPPRFIELPVTVDDSRNGDDVRTDVPVSFDPLNRAFTTRRVCQTWARVPTGATGDTTDDHDPFALLGW